LRTMTSEPKRFRYITSEPGRTSQLSPPQNKRREVDFDVPYSSDHSLYFHQKSSLGMSSAFPTMGRPGGPGGRGSPFLGFKTFLHVNTAVPPASISPAMVANMLGAMTRHY
jgi:hypothetical protein